MKWILRFFSWRYARRRPVRALLNVVVVALGVALYVAVDASNAGTETAFRQMVGRLTGNTQLQVVGPLGGGVDEALLARVDGRRGIKAAPVLQVATTVTKDRSGSPLLVLGLDLAREALFQRWSFAGDEVKEINLITFVLFDSVVVTRRFADRHGLAVGRSFQIDTPDGPRPVKVGAILKDEGPAAALGGNVAVMSLRTAQKLFRKAGRLDRIELRVEGNVDAAAKRLQKALGPEVLVRPPPQGSSLLDEALARIQALAGISVIALLVAVFIIYNSLSLAVVERIKEIGTLRALGATRRQVFGAVLTEGMVVGLSGTAAGIGLGYLLARILLDLAVREVNQVTTVVDSADVVLPLATVLLMIGVGGITSLLATYFPARQAMSVSPIEMIRHGSLPPRVPRGCKRCAAAGLAALGLAAFCIAGPVPFANAGLAGAFFAFLGASLVLPLVSLLLARAARPLLRRAFRLPGRLAADNLAKHPQRSALTATALAGTLALMVSAASIILSFKICGARWMDEALPYDCTVTAADPSRGIHSGAALPEELAAEMAAVEGVEVACGNREVLQPHGDRDILVSAFDVDAYVRMQARRGRTGLVPAGARAELQAGRGVVVSENFAYLHGARPGGTLAMETPSGPQRFSILAAVEDYCWPQGTVFFDRAVYRTLWNDPALSSVDILFRAGVPAAETWSRIEKAAARHPGVNMYDVAYLKQQADEVLDRSFLFANLQVTVAIFVGFLGILNTLFISVMRRKREIGLLRAVGMTGRQVSSMVVIESAFIAGVGGVAGIALGLASAAWPLAFHVRQISGYDVPLAIPWIRLLVALAAALVLGAVAGLIPARRASRMSVIEAIGYE